MNRKQQTEKFAINAIIVIVVFFIAALLSVSVQAQEAKMSEFYFS